MRNLVSERIARQFAVGVVNVVFVVCIVAIPAWAESPEIPDRFGFGRVPDPDEIEQWDIDITPAGTQLPGGQGTVGQGERIYVKQCLACHGPEGRNGINDKLVDKFDPANNFASSGETRTRKTIGNYWPYATTLYDYINRAMPLTAPGSLTADEVYSVTAYLLFLNDIVEQTVTVDANTLPAIDMPAKKLFYWSDEVLSLVDAKPDLR